MALVLIVSLFSCTSARTSFVKVKDGKFYSGDYPSHFIGTNFWYGAILGSEGQGGDRERLIAELDSLKAIGITNLRVLVGGDGPDGVPTRVSPTLQKEPGVYNDTIFRGLDYLLVKMAERGMKAVLYINNSWEWSGGYGMYLEWAGAGKALIPSIDGWPEFMEQMSGFVTNQKAKELYAAHVKNVVTRTNTITGKPYKDDPTIFSWQIGNEPRCFSADPAVQDAFVEWMWSAASLIKSLDSNHMVSTGSEGRWGCEGSMELYERIHSCPDIDYLNIHIWPYNWSWVKENTLVTNLPVAIKNTDEYIDEHLVLAKKYGKPVVMEEFGYPRDDFKFAKGTPTEGRDAYYSHVFGRIVDSYKEGDIFAGLNFWGWGGLASQSPVNLYWKSGDDYCGDPAQEQQGLNSVYASDTSTINIIKKATSQLAQPCVRVLVENDWLFGKEGGELRVSVNAAEKTVVPVQLTIRPDLGDALCDSIVLSSYVKSAIADTLAFPISLEPGFYRAEVSVICADGEAELVEGFNIGVEPDRIASPQDKPADFDEFWKQTLAELASVDPQYRLTLLPEHSDDVRRTYRVDMFSLGGEKISGVYVEPVKPGKYAATISYMGYNTQPWYSHPSANPELIEFTLCVRDQALNKTGEATDWCTWGLESREDYYYRGAFADVVRAIDFVCSREKTDLQRVVAEGESQGGAFTLVAASLDDRLKAIAPSAPFLCDYPDYFKLAHWPGNEIVARSEKMGQSYDELLDVLSYFDVKNFTDRITCPVLMGFGLQDPVCPPHTNFAGYNQIKSEKSWICYPLCDHSVWAQQGWQKAKYEFLNKYRKQQY